MTQSSAFSSPTIGSPKGAGWLVGARRIPSTLALVSSLALLPSCAIGRGAAEAASPSNTDKGPNREDDDELLVIERTQTPSPYFVRDGKPLCFMGASNYYLMYKSEFAVRSVLDSAKSMNLAMLRIWAFLDRGSLDGSTPNVHEPGHADGTYFQYWDSKAEKPAYNDSSDGLKKLDFVLSEARKRGLTLTLVLTNNWRDFGGMDQYLTWYGLKYHHEFYTDPRVRQAFQDWIHHIVNRVNSVDGVPYKEDPAIFAWELANEPRTQNYRGMDAQGGWTTNTITAWADEMSSYVKSQDPNHLVAVGDEGFFDRGQEDWAYGGTVGVDSERLTSLPNVDFGTYHLYPDHWGKGHKTWAKIWIEDHIEVGRRANKPMILEEYGIRVRRKPEHTGKVVHGSKRRAAAYTNWNNLLRERGGQAGVFWMLAGYTARDELYPDYDGFTVYEKDTTYSLLEPFSARMRTDAAACDLAGSDHGRTTRFVSTHSAPVKRTDAPPSGAPASTQSALPGPDANPT